MESRMSWSRLLVLFIGIPLVFGDTQYLSGTLRDQSPAAMANCGGNPGTANGGKGFTGTDFQISGYSTEYGLVGKLCNKANGWIPPACAAIGADQTPVYAYGDKPSPGGNIISKNSFYHWFHDTEQTFDVPFDLPLGQIPGTTSYTYKNDSFFPLDGRGWGDKCQNSKQIFHNFAYCFEAHTRFGFQGAEVFNFYGDDDVWVYIDGRLVIDLGSIHTKLAASVNLADIQGLSPGSNYRMDFFYCERHTTESNMEVTTTLQFYCSYTDWCGICEGNGQSCCTTDIIAKHCNDNSLCTTDTCSAQVSPIENPAEGCIHTPIKCPAAPDLCHVSSCDPSKGCVMTDVICDDGNLCTDDSCSPTSGCKYVKRVCNDGSVCTNDTCDPATGKCVYKDDSARCNDKSSCTIDSCSPTSGCVNTPKNCDDNNKCTNNGCDPASPNGCTSSAVNCDDGNRCTNDSCVPSTGCQNLVLPCNPPDKCSTAACSKTEGCQLTPVNCDDRNPCTDDSCDPVSGCINSPKNCDDGDACTTDACSSTSGQCTHVQTTPNCGVCGAALCTFTDPCKPVICNQQTQKCEIVPFQCNDNNACTNDTCVALNNAATCKFTGFTCPVADPCNPPVCDKVNGCGTVPFVCDDGNRCTTDSCAVKDEKATCVFTPVQCNTTDHCSPSSCNPDDGKCQNIPVVCNDNNLCTTDRCVANSSAASCEFTLIPCGDACAPATCDPSIGKCVENPIECDDLNPCTQDALECLTLTNGTRSPFCNYTIISDVCDDQDVCTNDFCNASSTVDGRCYHSNITCTPPTICQVYAGCDARNGCLYTEKPCPGIDDFCKIARCDPIAGCIAENKVCTVDDPGCFIGICDSNNSACITEKKSDYKTSTSSKQPGVLCAIVYNPAIKKAVISAGALAGIIIGAIIGAALIGLGGKAGYDFLQARNGAMGSVASNPLYSGPDSGGTSALYGSG